MQKLVAVLLMGFVAWPSSAFAYRPFDSTDPAIADLGDMEVEFSPVSFRHEDQGHTWIGPGARLNYGFAKGWEVVLEGQEEHPSFARSALVDNELSVKKILQEGTLQDKSGMSLATEASLLLPGINQDPGAGVTLTVSRASSGTGEPYTSISPGRSPGISTAKSFSAPSLKDRTIGKSALFQNSHMTVLSRLEKRWGSWPG